MTEPFIDKVAKNDYVVKTIFDHIRNLGLCAIVFAASGWKYRHMSAGMEWYVDVSTFALLLLVGFILLWINTVHGMHKLRAAAIPKWLKGLIGGVYGGLAFTIVMSLLAARGGG